MSILLAFAIAAASASLWALVCNERTFRQRNQIIAYVFGEESEWPSRIVHFDAVSYDAHFRCVLMMRDPMRLYPATFCTALRA